MKTIHVEVTQEDIDSGVPTHCCECPLARALSRAACEPVDVVVRKAFFAFDEIGFDLPPVAVLFRRDFDAGRYVRPIVFDVEVPR